VDNLPGEPAGEAVKESPDRGSLYSLADFYFSDSNNVLEPPSDFVAWRRQTQWATSLYEPCLASAAVPQARLDDGLGTHCVLNFASYNYLGLATHSNVIRRAQEALLEFGTGACGSPMLSGRTRLHRQLDDRLSAFLGRPAAMVFNSGFGGALGAVSGLLRKGDAAVVDSKVHISLLDGIRLSQAKMLVFEHNDPRSLDAALEKEKGRRRLIVVEGIYSMDGDMADLPALLPVAETHGVGILVDEAHSILICGERGRGIGEHFGLEAKIDLQYGTFSKAFAGLGGFLAGATETLDYLRCYANPYGFSCALPPSVVGGLLGALDVIESDPSLRRRIHDNAAYFRSQLHSLGVSTGESCSQVVPLIVGEDRALLYDLGHEMRRKGLFLAPVDYPSVAQDQVRFRASITAAHTREDLDRALEIIEDTLVRALRQRGLLRKAVP
jgi:glycine C-acetyltransferase